jgi:hypothetical protein
MKKLLFTLLIGLSMMTAKANHYYNSNLNLKLFDHSFFTIQFDDKIFDEYADEFDIYDIEAGNHYMKVVKSSPWIYGGPSGQITVFDGFIYIKPGKELFGVIDKFNRFKIIKQFPINGNSGNNNNYPPITYNYPMSDYDFVQLKQVIDNATFESSKMKIAEQTIASNYFYAEQVVELLNLFTFESSKLQIAKLAYPHTLNKGKYYIVNSAFTFESSIDELNQFILTH